LPSLALCASPPDSDQQQNRQRLERLEQEIRNLRRRVNAYSGAESTILGELEQLDNRLSLARRESQAAEARLAIARTRVMALDQNARHLELQTAQAEQLLARTLVRLYTQGAPDWLLLALGPGDPSELRSGLRYLAKLSREEAAAVSSLRELRSTSLSERQRAAEAVEELERLKGVLADKQAETRKAMAAKNASLDTITRKRARSQTAVRELEQAAHSLRQLFKDLPAPAPEPQPAPPPQATGFRAMRGRLPWPSDGRVKRGFGTVYHPRFHTAIEHTGLTIAAAAGSPVRAVHPGTVQFSDWFKGYGLLVILDHGASWYTLYAHLQESLVKRGDTLQRGQTLGLAGDTGSLEGPQLYFEVRHGATPLNPESWLGRRTTAGGSR
jgi:septal ring factor EnvC (AmiA/AmiB activator)